MKLNWTKFDNERHRYIAETPRYLFIMVAPPGVKPGLMVQHAEAKKTDKPIDQRTCRSRRHAEIMAQRFEDKITARRLRLPILVQY